MTKDIFGTFHLNEGEYALPATVLQEVVNPPARFTSLPLAPRYLLGLFNLRGAVIPVIDLKILLNLRSGGEGDAAPAEKKIAIIEAGGHLLGLLFDRTGEVFREDPREKNEFHDPGHGGVIAGVFKKEEGRRLVQILDAEKLLALEGLPKAAGEGSARDRRAGVSRRGRRAQCISFHAGPALCALGIDEIQEIVRVGRINESALAGRHCLGVVDLRGATVPIIDFPALLGYREPDTSPTATAGDRRVLVLRLGEELFGLLIDRVESIVTYYDDDLRSVPVLGGGGRAGMIRACLCLEGTPDVLLLAGARILDDAEIREITHGHAKLFRADAGGSKRAAGAGGARRTFITFALENDYAIPIHEVKEILSVADADKLELPEILYREQARAVDVVEALQVRDPRQAEAGAVRTLLIVSGGAIERRIRGAA